LEFDDDLQVGIAPMGAEARNRKANNSCFAVREVR
jgi:hypothetical protein